MNTIMKHNTATNTEGQYCVKHKQWQNKKSKIIAMGNTCFPCHIHLHRFAVHLPTLFFLVLPHLKT